VSTSFWHGRIAYRPSSPHESRIISRDENNHLRLASQPADYQKLGIDPLEVDQFEDGQRIGTERGRYEWWYFDAYLDDGAAIVVVFYTKPDVSLDGPLAPRITINLTLPDGRRTDKLCDVTADQFAALHSRFVGQLPASRMATAA
jgi:hypothetical protein